MVVVVVVVFTTLLPICRLDVFKVVRRLRIVQVYHPFKNNERVPDKEVSNVPSQHSINAAIEQGAKTRLVDLCFDVIIFGQEMA